METKIIEITPDIAREWLEKNTVNRNISPNRVYSYAEDIKKGKWQLNGESIKFNTAGRLVDGQHRLSAVVKANKPIKCVVMFDMPEDITIYDRGRNRNEADCLIISGKSKEVANNKCVAMAKLHNLIQSWASVTPFSFIEYFITKYEKELIDIRSLFKNGKSSSTQGFRMNVDNSCIALACFYAYMCGVSFETLSRFVNVLRTGFYDNQNHESAAIVLRNDLVSKSVDAWGGASNRINAVYSIEKALYDFDHKIDRKVSYKNNTNQIYSNNAIFKDDRRKN